MMSIHRSTPTNLPSIRVQEHRGSFDPGSGFDKISSAPRDIPFKQSSPISIAGSFDPSNAPPPLLPLGPIPSSGWDNRSDYGRDRHGTPKSPLERWGSGSMGRGFPGSNDSSKGVWDNRRQDESLKEARNGFERMQIAERQSGSLQSEESLRREAMSASMSAYDRDLLRKLSPIPPRSNQRTPYSPIDDTPASLESDFARRPVWNPTTSSSPIAIGSKFSESPMDRWNSRRDPMTSRMVLSPEQNPPVFPSSMDYRSATSDTLSVSSFGPNDDPYEQMRSPISGSLLRGNSFDDSRGRPPLSPRKSYDRLSRVDDDLMMDDIPSSHISKLSLRSETPPRSSVYPSIHNNSHRAGSKRRASSPINEDRGLPQGEILRKNYENSENPHRRSPSGTPYAASRYSPGMGSKFHPNVGMHSASTGSSFASSAGTGWSNSLGASSIGSAATNYSILDRSSPSASFSSPSDLDTSGDSPYMSNLTARTNRQRTVQDMHTTPLTDRDVIPQKLSPVHKLNGMYVCECCPKKPKKFDTKAELQVHKMEKQYACDFCNNRFKNKNEAERHRNSLHLRKHSWSCAALSGEKAAFHSSQRPGAFDVCGYCGKEFPTPANWDLRREHLTTEHKFGDCNQAKKFFRADHFRQHLKHSHSGTAGKWTNVLENACMRDEPGVDENSGIIGLGSSVISEE